MVFGAGIFAAVCLLPLFLFYPDWLKDFLFITFDNLGLQWYLPTLFVQMPLLLGPSGYVVWGVTLIASAAVSIWFWWNKDAQLAMIVSLALTPMVTAYASSWDFLLLLPAFFWLVTHLRTSPARVWLYAGMMFVIAAQIAHRWKMDILDGTQWWIPPVLISIYLIATGLDHFAARRSNAPVPERYAL